MIGYGFRWVWSNRAVRAASVLSALMMAAGCRLSSGPDNVPTSARVRVEGTGPDLELIISTDFFEQVNLSTGERTAVVNRADTLRPNLPFDQTFDLGNGGSVYVKLNNPVVETATVRLRVDLNEGQSYDQAATLSDQAALIYYFIFDNYG